VRYGNQRQRATADYESIPALATKIAQTVAAVLLLGCRRLCLAGMRAAAASLTASDFDGEPVLRLRKVLASNFGSVSTEAAAVGATSAAISAVALRPRRRSFASIERCSEYAGAVRG
jgi:hypothetical protein